MVVFDAVAVVVVVASVGIGGSIISKSTASKIFPSKSDAGRSKGDGEAMWLLFLLLMLFWLFLMLSLFCYI